MTQDEVEELYVAYLLLKNKTVRLRTEIRATKQLKQIINKYAEDWRIE